MDTEDSGSGVTLAPAKALKSRRKKRVGLALLVLFSLSVIAFAVIQWQVKRVAQGKTVETVAALNDRYVGLVFGCDDQVQGRENLYFKYRIEAAAELWHEGKIQCFIVSGDNREHNYNEPKKMMHALIAKGVPREKIVCDYAGLRTLDSVVRAKKIFGVEQCLMISQKFQNERAIYIAEAHGMKGIGYNARDVVGSGGRKTRFRELGARVMMWLDVHVLGTEPKHLGLREILPL